jgi:hypothetical protein
MATLKPRDWKLSLWVLMIGAFIGFVLSATTMEMEQTETMHWLGGSFKVGLTSLFFLLIGLSALVLLLKRRTSK